MFELLGVARWQYNILAQLGKASELSRGHVYAEEDVTDGLDVSILLHGSCEISKQGRVVGRAKPYEFIDSPEWIMSTQGGGAFPVTFEVSIKSEGCVIISWNRNALVKVFRREPFLKHIFDSIIGQDVAKKIFRQNKTMFTESTDEAAHTARGLPPSLPQHHDAPDNQEQPTKNHLSIRFPVMIRTPYGSQTRLNETDEKLEVSPLIHDTTAELGDSFHMSTEDDRNTNV